MKNTFKIFALLLAFIFIMTAIGSFVLAEGEEPGTEEQTSEPGGETSEPDNETSEPSNETSEPDDETSEPDDETSEPAPTPDYTVSFIGEGVTVYCNGKKIEDKYEGFLSEGARATVKIQVNEGYAIEDSDKDIDCDVIAFSSEGNGTYSATFKPSAGKDYVIKINAKKLPVPVSLKVIATAVGVNGYSLTVNGLSVSDASSASIIEGDSVSVKFSLDEGFDFSASSFTVNNEPASLDGDEYSFIITCDTTVALKPQTVSITVKIEGSGKVTAGDYGTFSALASGERVFEIAKDERVVFQAIPGENYKIQSINITEADHAGSNGIYTVVAHADSLFHVIFKQESIPVSNTAIVGVNVGMGGSISVAGKNVIGGTGTTIEVTKGESLSFTITPDKDYELDVFRVGGSSVTVTGNTYTISDITAATNVSVSFKSTRPVEVTGAITVDDVDWTADPIVIDIRPSKLVSREVLDKIATLDASKGKYVEFRGVYTTVYVPYGGKCEGSGTVADLSGKVLSSGELYEKIEKAISDKTSSGSKITHTVFSFNIGPSLPIGTLISFNLGEAFAESGTVMLTFDANESKFTLAYPQSVYVDSVGVSGKYEYNDQAVLILSVDVPGQYTIESSVINAGGFISPAGITSVDFGSDAIYSITASNGFVIKRIFVDDVETEGVYGLREYTYTFEAVNSNHTIKAEFELSYQSGGDDTDDNGNKTILVVLIILATALIGAAALFFVKWKQEKF